MRDLIIKVWEHDLTKTALAAIGILTILINR
jgi:hypothetical protein